jgi:hypothetical protein
MNQQLEKTSLNREDWINLREKIKKIIDPIEIYHLEVINSLYTIADYRRDFNDNYCNSADVLVWGETDMLVPKQMFTVLDMLHQNTQTPKYLATFGICKMWDDSWKPLDLIITNISPHKYNGCGLVISSEIIKSGVNIPRSCFFIKEDTAFMMMTQRVLGQIPQYHFKNILMVHNRKHPNKRMYIQGENTEYIDDQRKENEWYTMANQMCEQNNANLFNTNYKSYKWEDVWNSIK